MEDKMDITTSGFYFFTFFLFYLFTFHPLPLGGLGWVFTPSSLPPFGRVGVGILPYSYFIPAMMSAIFSRASFSGPDTMPFIRGLSSVLMVSRILHASSVTGNS